MIIELRIDKRFRYKEVHLCGMHICFVAFYNCSVRASDESENIDPCDLYNDIICEYQQVQRSHDTDGPEEEILSSDETSVCDSSGSVPQSVCGGNLDDLSDDAMDFLINESVDGCGDSSARREFTDIFHAPGVGDEALDSQGKLSRNEDDRNMRWMICMVVIVISSAIQVI